MMPQLPMCLDLPICLLAYFSSVATADMAFQDAVCWVA